jgi:cell division protein FtsQ
MITFDKYLALGNSRRVRALVRSSAFLFLMATLAHGVLRGGYLYYDNSPWLKLPGKLSSLIGLASDDIRISGLTYHDPQILLTALNVTPGGSLVQFDAVEARHTLESIDWIASASVQRTFPNKLQISVRERVPFAIWQRGTGYSLIDRSGVAMSGLELMGQSHLMLVSGEGANFAAEQLVNHLEANPELMKKVGAAAMVGKRRWTLYLKNGVKIALPVEGIPEALAKISALDASQNILSKGIRDIDLRIVGRMTVAIAEIEQSVDVGKAHEKLSQKQ